MHKYVYKLFECFIATLWPKIIDDAEIGWRLKMVCPQNYANVRLTLKIPTKKWDQEELDDTMLLALDFMGKV